MAPPASCSPPLASTEKELGGCAAVDDATVTTSAAAAGTDSIGRALGALACIEGIFSIGLSSYSSGSSSSFSWSPSAARLGAAVASACGGIGFVEASRPSSGATTDTADLSSTYSSSALSSFFACFLSSSTGLSVSSSASKPT
eukprot:06812_1